MGLEKINELKKQMKLTNKQLSQLSGVPLGTLDKITSGVTSDPKLETLKALAKVLNCSLDEFNDNAVSSELYRSSNLTRPLIEKYLKLDSHGRRVVDTIIDFELERLNHKP